MHRSSKKCCSFHLKADLCGYSRGAAGAVAFPLLKMSSLRPLITVITLINASTLRHAIYDQKSKANRALYWASLPLSNFPSERRLTLAEPRRRSAPPAALLRAVNCGVWTSSQLGSSTSFPNKAMGFQEVISRTNVGEEPTYIPDLDQIHLRISSNRHILNLLPTFQYDRVYTARKSSSHFEEERIHTN